MIRQRPNWELAVSPQSNIVCFRWVPPGAGKEVCNEINARIRGEILKEGRFYIVQTQLNGLTYLRTSLMNPFTTREHLEELLETCEKYGKA